MALSLTAEQKSLMDLFTTRDKYIIPTYQRPYSWEYEECLKLYSDIIDAYNDRKDYFLGNVIISRSKRDANRPQVVDGQQRLTTLWLVFKALSVLLPDIQVLHEVTTVRSWDGNTFEVKLESKISQERLRHLQGKLFRKGKNKKEQDELMECYLHSEDLGNLVVLDVSKKNAKREPMINNITLENIKAFAAYACYMLGHQDVQLADERERIK